MHLSFYSTLDRQLPDLVKDRVVLIGTIAPSFKDYHLTSNRTPEQPEIAGVIVHAHMVSQILSAVGDNRPLLTWLPEWKEVILLWGCSLVTGLWFCYFTSSVYRGIAVTTTLLVIPGIGYILFLKGIWLPIVASVLVVVTMAGTIVFWTTFRQRPKRPVPKV